jgi:glycerophosphoryl diester phosphodiesterase
VSRPPLPRVVAHRGGAREAPENTLAAFAHAVACGADGVELDARLAADGEVVVFHDEELGRFHAAAARVDSTAARDLAALDLGRRRRRFRGERIPTLAQALAVVAPLALVNVELKAGGDAPRLVEAVLRALDDARLGGRALVTSFDSTLVERLGAARPTLARGLVLDAPPADDAWSAHQVVSLSCALARGGWAARAAAAGLRVLVWTENDPRRFAGWARLGVEAVITDRPARFAAARAAAAQSPSGRRV